MKKLIPFFSLAIFATACNTGVPKEAEVATKQETTVTLDTAGLAAYQNWKAQNELSPSEQTAAQPVQPAPVVQKEAPAKSRVATTARSTKRTTAPRSSRTEERSSAGSGNSTAKGEGGSMSSESAETAKAGEKKGWSKATKGAVIGGATGAAAGAILVKKNRAAGAVIGGVVGAIGGHVIGGKMDKKDGRTN